MFNVYNQRLAGWLMLHGHQLKSIAPNDQIRGFNVFVFDSTRDVSASISDYFMFKNTNERE